jgi:ComF family protein
MNFDQVRPYWESFMAVLYPQVCLHCSSVVSADEPWLCTHCRTCMPLVPDILVESEMLRKRFLMERDPKHVFSFLRFHKQGMAQSLLHALKYKSKPELGIVLGHWFGTYLMEQAVWPGVELILPVPLHPSKLARRGYNQSFQIAKGLAEVVNIPAEEHLLLRRKASATQTRKKPPRTLAKMLKNIFEVTDSTFIRGRNILLVDDVLTTGATLEACMQPLYEAGAQKISAAVLAAAQI